MGKRGGSWSPYGLWAALTRRGPSARALTVRLRQIGDEPREPSPEFRARLRGQLLAAHGTAGETGPEPAVGAGRRPPLLLRLRPAAMVVSVTGLMALTGLQTYGSVPGDHLYPIKRAAEATLLSLAPDDLERAQRELTAAHSRATEAAALLGYPGDDRERFIGPTLDEMADTTRSALLALRHVKRRDTHTPSIKRFTEQQRDLVAPMLPQLGDDDRTKASAYLDMIDDLTP
ncbi:hypothetical protein GCM10009677_26430 [Sphaerisporangium rubeum]|uniref:DUF5667 domain-containing protein n=1 Tax=Sphaerisporangium rubeum TaxID=321317 RepID=A0A7X0IBC4_9ACTN|nr:DUF5667 domain-containing protein [Sphaerisporangium rubeum]MBB6471354.1 hypothetical protein [Sphaerisporangium rubeum]